jgi:hypothetical protein
MAGLSGDIDIPPFPLFPEHDIVVSPLHEEEGINQIAL